MTHTRLLFGIAICAAATCLAAPSESPQATGDKRPYERLLQASDAERAAEIVKRIAAAELADDWAQPVQHGLSASSAST